MVIVDPSYVLYLVSFPFTLVFDTLLLPISVPFEIVRTEVFARDDREIDTLNRAIRANDIRAVKQLTCRRKNYRFRDWEVRGALAGRSAPRDRYPFYIAHDLKRYEIMLQLIESHVTINERTLGEAVFLQENQLRSEGRSPPNPREQVDPESFFSHLSRKNIKEIAPALKSHPEVLNPFFLFSVRCENLDLVRNLIQLGADVNYRDRWVAPALNQTENLEVLRILLDNGAHVKQSAVDLIIRDLYGFDGVETPERLRILRLFLLHGGRVDSLDREGAMWKLCERVLGTKDHDIIVSIFENGFEWKYWRTARDEKSLLTLAREKQDTFIVQYLEQKGMR